MSVRALALLPAMSLSEEAKIELESLLEIYADNEDHKTSKIVYDEINQPLQILFNHHSFSLILYVPSHYPESLDEFPTFEYKNKKKHNLKIGVEMLVESVQQYINDHCGGGNMILFTIIEMFCDQHSNNSSIDVDNFDNLLASEQDGKINAMLKNNNFIDISGSSSDAVYSDLGQNLAGPGSSSSGNDEELSVIRNIVHGSPLTDRKSVFIGHCCPVRSAEEVEIFYNCIKMDKKYQSATHNILAYRYNSSSDHCGCSTVVHDYDDDGESAAGSRMAELMRLIPVENVAVVVSRWFGGVKLGPERFKLINNTCRDILDQCGFITKKSHGKKGKSLK